MTGAILSMGFGVTGSGAGLAGIDLTTGDGGEVSAAGAGSGTAVTGASLILGVTAAAGLGIVAMPGAVVFCASRVSSNAAITMIFKVRMTAMTGNQIFFLPTGRACGVAASVGVSCSRRSFSLLRNASRMKDIVLSLPCLATGR